MSKRPTSDGTLPLRVRAEAAAWLAGLRGSSRTSELDVRFKHWLAESEANRVAWEQQNDAWEIAGGLLSRFESVRESPTQTIRRDLSELRRLFFATVAVLSAAVAALVLAWLIAGRAGAVTTATGERRTAVLPDDSRVTLNTDTRIVVQYTAKERRVRLDTGEALFEVRKDAGRPFVVVAGDREIRALGTAFEVRREEEGRVAVTLITGRISIAQEGGKSEAPARAESPVPEVTILSSPGQRITFVPHEPPKLDHPVLQQLIAWQSGEVVFNRTPLPEAAREMNRYSERQILVEGSGADALHVGGLFRAGESMAFAQAVAETFGLGMREEGRNIILSTRKPSDGTGR